MLSSFPTTTPPPLLVHHRFCFPSPPSTTITTSALLHPPPVPLPLSSTYCHSPFSLPLPLSLPPLFSHHRSPAPLIPITAPPLPHIPSPRPPLSSSRISKYGNCHGHIYCQRWLALLLLLLSSPKAVLPLFFSPTMVPLTLSSLIAATPPYLPHHCCSPHYHLPTAPPSPSFPKSTPLGSVNLVAIVAITIVGGGWRYSLFHSPSTELFYLSSLLLRCPPCPFFPRCCYPPHLFHHCYSPCCHLPTAPPSPSFPKSRIWFLDLVLIVEPDLKTRLGRERERTEERKKRCLIKK